MICSAAPNFFIHLDIALLKFLNVAVSNPVFDVVMPVITRLDYWRWPIVLALIWIAVFGGRYGLITVLLGIILATISDQVSSNLLKDLVGRIRPCHDIAGIHVLTGCGNSKSFPSSHAVNSMAAALLFGYRYRKLLPWLIGVSVAVSYSRIYIGIHYPGDVLAGWLLGAICAFFVLFMYRQVQKRWPKLDQNREWAWMTRLKARRKKSTG
jgi:undecaprenyl-diphosphatase